MGVPTGVRGVVDPADPLERDPLDWLCFMNPDRDPDPFRQRVSMPEGVAEEDPRRQSPPFRAEAKVLESRIPRRLLIFCWVSWDTVGGMALRKAKTAATGGRRNDSVDIPTEVRRVFSMSLPVVYGLCVQISSLPVPP